MSVLRKEADGRWRIARDANWHAGRRGRPRARPRRGVTEIDEQARVGDVAGAGELLPACYLLDPALLG